MTTLEVAWSYPHGLNAFNPIYSRGVIYTRGRTNALVALDATTGKEIWVHDQLGGMALRGINYWESRDGRDRRLIFTINDYLQEIDALTGKTIRTFGTNGVVDLREGLGRDPATIGRVQSGHARQGLAEPAAARLGSRTRPTSRRRAICAPTTSSPASSSGSSTRCLALVSSATRRGRRTPTNTSAAPTPGASCRRRRARYRVLPHRLGRRSTTTAATGTGANLFANCLIALDARTGKRLWHFQNVHHDLWDLDNTSAPMLTTIRQNGRSIDVVAMAGKTGYLYVFNRVTGEPIWPIEERPVPTKTDVPGEQIWPTQPFPTNPPPFGRQKFAVNDINPYILTPQQREEYKTARRQGAQRRRIHADWLRRSRPHARQPRRVELRQHVRRTRATAAST